MSAPKTNIEKQKKRHRGVLRGMAAMVIFAVVLLGGLLFFVAYYGNDPQGAETQIDGRTGVETTDSN